VAPALVFPEDNSLAAMPAAISVFPAVVFPAGNSLAAMAAAISSITDFTMAFMLVHGLV
jgi:hypothetical protein